MKKFFNLFITACMVLTMVLVPCTNVHAEGEEKAIVNVEIQDVFGEFNGDISLCLRNPISDDIKEFKGGSFPKVTYEVYSFGECNFISIEGNGEWCFVDATTLKSPVPFSIKENDVVNVTLLLFPTENNTMYGDYVKMYTEGIDVLMNNDIVADVLENVGIDDNNSSINIQNNSTDFNFNSWHDGAMASFNSFNDLFSAVEENSTWQGYLANAEIRRNVSLNYYLESVGNADEDKWKNMSKTEILIWQDTYLVFVEMLDKGSEYFSKTFSSQQTTEKWLKSIIGTSAWTGEGNKEIYDAYCDFITYQIEYYRYYGYPYNFINDKSYSEETSLFPSDSEESEESEILEDLSEEEKAEIEEEISLEEENVGEKSADNWKPVLKKLKGSWITLIILGVVATAYFIVRKIRKSKNYDEMSK